MIRSGKKIEASVLTEIKEIRTGGREQRNKMRE